MPNELEKRTAVYELLRASVPPAEIIRLLKYPRRTVYDIKKRYDAELAANGNIAEGAGEPSAARKSHSRRRDSLDNLNPEFVRDLQRRIDEDPGRSIAALAGDMDVGRVTAAIYIDVMSTVVKPWMDKVAAGRSYVFQQDGAPAHNAKVTQDWLSANLPDFWGKELWMPGSPDCNPLDYYFWGACERTINRAPHNTLDSLKTSIMDGFANMPREEVTRACSRFRSRVEKVIEAEGSFFK